MIIQYTNITLNANSSNSVSKFYRTANILYSSPISRATTYLLGIGAGIFQRTNQGIIDLTPEMIPFGWILACLGIFWCLWSPSAGMRTDFIYTSSDAASYASWCPLVFGLSLCWFIFMFPKSENSIIRFLLSSRPILIDHIQTSVSHAIGNVHSRFV